nr:putative reverse transcriptase domain-containing protein [Tanacetum cinerariifolium]
MVNVISPNHVDDVPVVEPDQHDDVPVVPEPVLVDEDEDPKENEFKEKENHQEEEDDMKVDIEEDENEPELTSFYEEMDPLNPPSLASESELEGAVEVENPIEHEDETVPDSVHEVGESSTAPLLREDSDGLLPGLMRRDINSLLSRMASLLRRLCGRETSHALVEKKGKAKDEFYSKLILDLGNEVHSRVEQGTTAMEKLVEKLGNVEDKVVCKKLKNQGLATHSFICKTNEITPQKSAPLTHAAIRRMIKDGVDAAIVAERARAVKLLRWFEKTKSVFGISKYVEGKKVRFAAATLQGSALNWWNAKVKEYNIVAYTQRLNEHALICPRMVEPERVKVDAYIQGLTDNIKGEVTSSRAANLNEAIRMDYKLMDQKAEQDHTRNRCPKKVKQEEVREVCGRAYAIKDAELKGSNVVTDLADGRVVNTNPTLKGFTLNLVNHVFEIDLMPIELGTFDVIIGMDWLVKHDAVIIYGEKVV